MKKINLKSTATSNYKPLPEGRYDVEVDSVKIGETLDKKDPMLNIKFKVMTPIESKGKVLWGNMSLSDDALGFLKMFLEAVGSPLVDAGEVVLEDFIKDLCTDLVGRQASCAVIIKTTNTGKVRNDLRYWKPVGPSDEGLNILS